MNTEAHQEVPRICTDELDYGAEFEVRTETRTYTLTNLSAGYVMIAGHPRHCPEPVVAKLCGVSSSPDARCITQGMRLMYFLPDHGFIRTTEIQQIRSTAPKRSLGHRIARFGSRLWSFVASRPRQPELEFRAVLQ